MVVWLRDTTAEPQTLNCTDHEWRGILAREMFPRATIAPRSLLLHFSMSVLHRQYRRSNCYQQVPPPHRTMENEGSESIPTRHFPNQVVAVPVNTLHNPTKSLGLKHLQQLAQHFACTVIIFIFYPAINMSSIKENGIMSQCSTLRKSTGECAIHEQLNIGQQPVLKTVVKGSKFHPPIFHSIPLPFASIIYAHISVRTPSKSNGLCKTFILAKQTTSG